MADAAEMATIQDTTPVPEADTSRLLPDLESGGVVMPVVTEDDAMEGHDGQGRRPWYIELIKLHRVTKYGLGVALILLVAVIWVAASEWIKFIFGEMDFNKPYFLTYLNTTLFSLWNIGYLVRPSWRAVPWTRAGALGTVEDAAVHGGYGHRESDSDESTGSPQNSPAACAALDTNTSLPAAGEDTAVEEAPKEPYTLREMLVCAAYFCPMWFFANVLFNYSLSRTSVASNTILSTTSSMWALILQRVFLKHPVYILKFGALILTLGGSAMVGVADDRASHSSSKDTVAGDALALISAFFYAAYTTVLKWRLPDDERYSMGQVFGMVGVLNLCLMWPGLIFVHFAGIEPFELPGWEVFGALLLNSLVGTNLSDVLWARSVILTSPFVATIGLSLTTPFALVSDFLLWGKHFTWLYVGGAAVVTSGFIVANV